MFIRKSYVLPNSTNNILHHRNNLALRMPRGCTKRCILRAKN